MARMMLSNLDADSLIIKAECTNYGPRNTSLVAWRTSPNHIIARHVLTSLSEHHGRTNNNCALWRACRSTKRRSVCRILGSNVCRRSRCCQRVVSYSCFGRRNRARGHFPLGDSRGFRDQLHRHGSHLANRDAMALGRHRRVYRRSIALKVVGWYEQKGTTAQ
jgi:hypothetical protein